MTWQSSQQLRRGGATLGAMQAAVLMASQKPLAEQAMQQISAILAKVPSDINWLKFQAGVQAYQNAPYTPRTGYEEIARAGRVTLRDAGGMGPTVVVIPSMVNRGYVLDLLPGHSLIEALRNAGNRVLLVDWGEPTDEICTLEQIIIGHLLPLLKIAAEQNSINANPVSIVGYCMGGLLGLAGAMLAGPTVVGKLALVATPWDFSVTPSSGHMLAARPVLEPWLGSQKTIPAEAMQQYFWLLDPWNPIRRLSAYGESHAIANSAKIAYLTALEDWLGDGLALDAPIAREILIDWYADNRTLNGNWKIDGQIISPANLQIPLWAAIGQRDNLVPPGCAMPLIAQGHGAQLVMADAGHVGLVVGRSAPEKVYKPLAAWLK